ncbi:MAG: tryptophan synthase subunit alpha [Candidatus Aminicenantes bacterium]|nr:tryptophan synthase subunit alpha [Candidatus Aminicenantes bacterium]
MTDDIARAFLHGSKPLLVTHVVAGYPDLDRSRKTVETMAAAGAGMIEVQIPFSDPIADGPVITAANRAALAGGTKPADVFRMIRRLKKCVSAPLLVMTYANIPYRMGLERFAAACAESGAAGAIIPDLPVDEFAGNPARVFHRRGTALIPVLSPGMSKLRIRRVLDSAAGFVYVTLRTGTTGARSRLAAPGLSFIDRLRRETALPLAAGFGISEPAHVWALGGKVDAVVIGSRLIRLRDESGLKAVADFLRDCRRGPKPGASGRGGAS